MALLLITDCHKRRAEASSLPLCHLLCIGSLQGSSLRCCINLHGGKACLQTVLLPVLTPKGVVLSFFLSPIDVPTQAL